MFAVPDGLLAYQALAIRGCNRVLTTIDGRLRLVFFVPVEQCEEIQRGLNRLEASTITFVRP